MFNKKRDLKTEHREYKKFSYENNGVVLNFELRIDTKDQLESFLQILDQATRDVDEKLTKF